MTTSPFQPFLDAQGFAVLDGGLATALEDAGHRLDTALWSARVLIDAPEAVRAVHARYLRAGADCVTTATYQASLDGLRAAGLADAEAERLLVGAVRLAAEARDTFWEGDERPPDRLRPIVAASVGPYGAYLADGSEYDGRYGVGRERLRDFHGRRLEILAAAGADVLACETIPSLAEAEVILDLLDELGAARAWLTFACRDDSRLCDGAPFREAVQRARGRRGLVGVGVNCTAPRHVAALLEGARDVATVPLVAYPNSGERYDARAKRWSGGAAGDDWVEAADAWLGAGARIVGGCCRVGPDAIRALRRRLAAAGAASAG